MATHTGTVDTYDINGKLIETRVVTWDSTPEQDNETTLTDRATAALVDLRALANTTGTLSNAQVANGLRLLARVAIGLIRLQLRQLDATD